MKKILALCLCIILMLTAAACSNEDDNSSNISEKAAKNDYPITVNGVTVEKQPGKVVSLSPSLTEIVYGLGYEGQLVGVSSYCDYPAKASDKANCGTAQAPDLAKIKELAPQVLITATPLVESDLIALQQMDINVIQFSHAPDLDKVYTLYEDLARLFGGEEGGKTKAGQVLDPYKRQLSKMEENIKSYLASGDKLRGAYLRMLDFTLATGDTLEGDILEMIGLQNEAAEYGEWTYPSDKAESLLPDVLFYDKSIAPEVLKERPAYKTVEAVKNERCYPVDSVIFERQGLRMFDTILEMASLAYSEAVTAQPQAPASADEENSGGESEEYFETTE